MEKKEYVFRDLINDNEFELIKINGNEDSLIHPVLSLLMNEEEIIESNSYTAYTRENTKSAINALYSNHINWLKKEKKKLLEKDRSSVSAALGEIRCFGYLSNVFGEENVEDINESKEKATPDFCVDVDGEKIYIEVNTIQINGKQGEDLRDFYESIQSSKKEKTICIGEHITRPFGDKEGATTVQSTILKLIAIKESNHQLSKDNP